MEIESRSTMLSTIVVRLLVAEAILFFITAVICWLLKQLNWNGFFSALFIIGLLTILVGGFLGKDIALVSKSVPLAGQNDEARILRGSRIFLVSTVGAGILAMVLSLVIPLMFPS